MILYASELEVDNAKLTSKSKDELNGKIELDQETERLKVTFDKKLEVNFFQTKNKLLCFFLS